MPDAVPLDLSLLKFSFLVSIIFASIRHYATIVIDRKETIFALITGGVFEADFRSITTLNKLDFRLSLVNLFVSFLSIFFIPYLLILACLVTEFDLFKGEWFIVAHKIIIVLLMIFFCFVLGICIPTEKKIDEMKNFSDKYSKTK